MTGAKFKQVFYRGAAAMLPDFLTGRIHLSLGDMASLLPSIKDGALKPLAVTTSARSPLLPNVPTISSPALKATMPPPGTACLRLRRRRRTSFGSLMTASLQP